jgi:hypothetical protein
MFKQSKRTPAADRTTPDDGDDDRDNKAARARTHVWAASEGEDKPATGAQRVGSAVSDP